MRPEIGIGRGNDRICQRLGQMLRIGFAQRNVTAWRVVGRKGEKYMLARAVEDLRGLQQQSIGRVEICGEKLGRRQVAREADVGERAHDDERRRDQRQDHPQAEQGIARAGFTGMLLGNAPFAPGTEDGDGGGHGSIVKDEGGRRKWEG